MSETTNAGNNVLSDLEIAQRAVMKPIGEIAAAAGINPEALELDGPYKAKIDPAKLNVTAGAAGDPVTAARQSGARLGDVPHRRAREVDHHRRARRFGPGRAQSDDRAARTLPRAHPWHERWRHGRRVLPGAADGPDQPALHRRLPRHHLGEQRAHGPRGQPHFPRQRTEH